MLAAVQTSFAAVILVLISGLAFQMGFAGTTIDSFSARPAYTDCFQLGSSLATHNYLRIALQTSINARCIVVCKWRKACAGGISLWQRRGRRSLSDVETSSEEEEGVADLRKHTDTEDKVSAIVCSL